MAKKTSELSTGSEPDGIARGVAGRETGLLRLAPDRGAGSRHTGAGLPSTLAVSAAATGHGLPSGQPSSAAPGFFRRHRASLVLGIVAGCALVGAMWPEINGRTARQPPGANLAELRSSDWVARLLTVGDRSPGGIDATNIAVEDALARAEQLVFDKGSDIGERKFWLRKSISLMLAEPGSRWAASQLGALKTRPDGAGGAADYKRAKTLWELASISGDTIATCFIAKLYEFGLGVPESERDAAAWREKAVAKGGCRLEQERASPSLTN